MSTNYLALANYSFPTVNASSITVGSSINMNRAAFSTLTGSTITVSTLSLQSNAISLGQSTSQAYNNFTNGSFTAGWVSSLSTTASTAGAGLSRVQKVTMSQSGQYQLAVQSSVASYSVVKSSDSGVSWQTLTNGANGLPSGSPVYTSISYSATGQYALAAVNEGGLYVSNNATAATPTFTSLTFTPYAYLTFDNTVADAIGNANPIATGSPAYVTGQVGNAINLANTMGSTATRYVRGTWSGSNHFTVSGRFNAQTVTGGQYGIIFSAIGTGITLYITDSAALVFFIGSSPTAGMGTGSNYVVQNTWYSFTIIYQLGGTSSIYINGTLIGSVSNTGAVTNAYARTNLFGLGTYDNALSNAFNGYIDDFRIYNYATTATRWTHTAVSATGQYMLAAAAGGGLFQSSNYGQTWTQVNELLNGGVWTSLSINASGQYALATTSAATIQPNVSGITGNVWSANSVRWAASASSSYSNAPYFLFNTVADNWASSLAAANTYTSSGSYDAGATTRTITQNVGTVSGEWFQLQSSIPLVAYSFSYVSFNAACTAKTYYILGSNDGTTWFAIHSGSYGATNPCTNTTQTTAIIINSSGVQSVTSGATGLLTTTAYSTAANTYTYFRFVGASVWSNPPALFLQYGEFYINFVGGLTCTSNYGQTWSNVANSLFADSSAVSGDGQYTLGVNNQSASTVAYLPFENSPAATGSGLTYSSTIGSAVTYSAISKVGSYSANFTASTPGGGGSVLNYTVSSAFYYPAVFTVSLWIYPTALPASLQACPFAFNNGSTSGGPFFSINPTTNYLNFGINATGGNVNITGSTATTINTWYHLVGVCSNGTGYFYVNGTLIGIGGYTGTPSVSGGTAISNVFIGANNTNGLAFAGYVDDVRIYTSALSANAIAELYAVPTLNPIPQLYLGNNYMTSLSSSLSYTPITLPNINAAINCASCSNTGQYMVVLTQGTTNNVYYSTNYGYTWTSVTVGSSAMTSCAMSLDGTYITVSNATNVYTLNWNSQGYTVAMGSAAGAVNQANNAIAIGNSAGQTNQTANSIVLNASATAVNPYTQGFYVAPIAQAISSTAPTFPLLGYGSDNQIVQSATSFSNSQQTVYGEWIQYQLATPSPITSYTLYGRSEASQRYPSSWMVVGSNDGANWTFLDMETGTSGWGTYTVSQPTAPYTYYRLIITQIPSAAGNYVDIGAWILNNGSPIFGASANYTVVASGLYNVLQLNGTTVCTTTFSWANTTAVNSLGIGADGPSGSALPPGWIPTTDAYVRGSTYFLGFGITGFGPQYEYNSSGIATQGTSTTINTTVLGNTNMSGMLCLSSGSRVGIGSTSPQYALDVAGTMQANGLIPAYGQPDSVAVVPNSTFGQQWNAIGSLPTNGVWYGCAVSATGQYMTINTATGGGLVWYSSNYGASWTQSGLAGANYSSVAMSGDGRYQIVGINSGGSAVYLSTNYGVTWTAISGWTGLWYRYALSYTGQYQYLVSSTFIYYSSNYGASFTTVSAGAYYTICCSSSGQYVYAGTQNGYILYSTNYGVSWSQSNSVYAVWTAICCSASGQYVTAMRAGNLIYYSKDYGVTWSTTGITTSGGFGLSCSASGQYQMACITGTGIYYSTNYGISWTFSGASSGNWQCVSMSQNGLYAIAVMNTGAVYLSNLYNLGLVTNGRVGIGVTNPASSLHIMGPYASGGLPALGSTTSHSSLIITQQSGQYGLNVVVARESGTVHMQSQYFNGNTSTALPLTLNPIGGNVGIGTTNPQAPLHVEGVWNQMQISGSSSDVGMIINNRLGTGRSYTIASSSTGSGITTPGLYLFDNTGGAPVMIISATRSVQIGYAFSNSSAYTFQVVSDSAAKPGSNTWTISSDERIKENIVLADVDRCVEIIRAVPLKHYRWKDEVYTIEQVKDRSKLGWIAQDVEKVFPKAVNINPLHYNQVYEDVVKEDGSTEKKLVSEDVIEDCRDLNADQIYAVMYGAIQKLITENDSKTSQILTQAEKITLLESQLTAQTSAQASSIASLEARLAALESK